MDEAGFWSNVNKNGPVVRDELGPCWLWTRSTHGRGYGQLSFHGKHYGAHVLAFEFANGPRRIGARILHHCDNPPCIRASHLYAGTDKDNASDRDRRRRSRAHVRPDSYARGEAASHARLTEAQVIELRSLYASGASSYELGSRYGIDATSAWLAATGRTWKHVPMPPARSGRRTGKDHPRGAAILTEDDVSEIRRRYAAGERQPDLAERFGVSPSAISAIIRRQNWKHIP